MRDRKQVEMEKENEFWSWVYWLMNLAKSFNISSLNYSWVCRERLI
jgi:hypothetical protein